MIMSVVENKKRTIRTVCRILIPAFGICLTSFMKLGAEPVNTLDRQDAGPEPFRTILSKENKNSQSGLWNLGGEKAKDTLNRSPKKSKPDNPRQKSFEKPVVRKAADGEKKQVTAGNDLRETKKTKEKGVVTNSVKPTKEPVKTSKSDSLLMAANKEKSKATIDQSEKKKVGRDSLRVNPRRNTIEDIPSSSELQDMLRKARMDDSLKTAALKQQRLERLKQEMLKRKKLEQEKRQELAKARAEARLRHEEKFSSKLPEGLKITLGKYSLQDTLKPVQTKVKKKPRVSESSEIAAKLSAEEKTQQKGMVIRQSDSLGVALKKAAVRDTLKVAVQKTDGKKREPESVVKVVRVPVEDRQKQGTRPDSLGITIKRDVVQDSLKPVQSLSERRALEKQRLLQIARSKAEAKIVHEEKFRSRQPSGLKISLGKYAIRDTLKVVVQKPERRKQEPESVVKVVKVPVEERKKQEARPDSLNISQKREEKQDRMKQLPERTAKVQDSTRAVVKEVIPAEKPVVINREKVMLDSLVAAVNTSYMRGMYDNNTLTSAKQVLVLSRKVYGVRSSSDAAALKLLADVYLSRKQYAMADPLYKQALDIRESLSGKERSGLGLLLTSLGVVSAEQENYAVAERYYKQALDVPENAGGLNSFGMATTLSNMGRMYLKQRNMNLATLFYNQAVALREQTGAPPDPGMASILNNVAELYSETKQFDAALQLYQKALAIFEKTEGPMHPDVASSISGIASIYLRQSQYTGAELLFQKTLSIQEQAYGSFHSEVAKTMQNLASVCRLQQKYDAAQQYMKRSMDMTMKIFPPHHLNVAKSLNSMALIYDSRGQYAVAEAYYRKALVICESNRGKGNYDYAQILDNMAQMYLKMGRQKQSESLSNKARSIRDEADNR